MDRKQKFFNSLAPAEFLSLNHCQALIVHAKNSERNHDQNSPQDIQNDILALLLNPCNKTLLKMPSSVKESGKNQRLGLEIHVRFEPKLHLCSTTAKTKTSNLPLWCLMSLLQSQDIYFSHEVTLYRKLTANIAPLSPYFP